jgi:hypothetical protein
MSLRKITAGLLILLFTAVSLPTFLYFGLSNTVFRKSFYEGALVEKTHDLLLNATAKKLLTVDEVISDYFTESDIKAEMLEVFPVNLFGKAMADFGSQIEQVRDGDLKTITISMDVYRRSLLTLANNLSYRLFETLPRCGGGEVPSEDVRGLPTCVPEGVEYNMVAAPFAKQFEASVYLSVPEVKVNLEQISVAGSVSLATVIGWFFTAKNVLYAALLLMLVLIALLIFSPFSAICKYEGIAFILSGISGYLLCLGLSWLPAYLLSGADLGEMGPQVVQYAGHLVSAVSAESQKVALIFVALGAVLVLVRVFMVNRYNEKPE